MINSIKKELQELNEKYSDNITKFQDNNQRQIDMIKADYEKKVKEANNELDKQTKEEIRIYLDAMFKTAELSNKCCNNLDEESKKLIPNIHDLGTKIDGPFNPKTVYEVKDDDVICIKQHWNTEKGLLPNRKVMGYYYYCNYYDVKGYYYDTLGHKLTNTGGYLHKISLININQITINGLDELIHKKIDTSQKFEIDNYLNLYNVKNNTYIMFNKTSFPMFPFYINKISYNSKYNRDGSVSTIRHLIPPNLKETYDFFNKFRLYNCYTCPEESTVNSDEFNQLVQDAIDSDEELMNLINDESGSDIVKQMLCIDDETDICTYGSSVGDKVYWCDKHDKITKFTITLREGSNNHGCKYSHYRSCIYCMMIDGNTDNEKWDDWDEVVCRSNNIVKLGYYDYKRGLQLGLGDLMNNVVTRYEFGRLCAKNGLKLENLETLDQFDDGYDYSVNNVKIINYNLYE